MGAVAAAARRLGRTPSAVTRSIAELESAIGTRLLDRSSAGVRVNGYGAIVLTRARRIEAELGQAALELQRLKAYGRSPPASAVDHLLHDGRKLRLLVELTARRKMAAAGAEIGLTQSGVSMTLARIEAALGAPLFLRVKAGVIATEITTRVTLRARRVFAELRHMLAEIAAELGTLSGSVVIGTPPLGRTYVVPAAIASLLSAHPQVRVTMMETSFDPLIAGLKSGDIDAIVGVPRDDSDMEGLAIERLFADRLTIVARAGHPLASRTGLALADLVGVQWILPWSASPSRTLTEICFRNAGLPAPAPSVESADLAVIRQLLVTSDMLAVASARQMMFELRSRLLVELSIPLSGMTRNVGLILRGGAMLSRTACALLDAIRIQVALERDGPAG